MNDESTYLLLSGIQHFIYCRRQWALIHIEQLWGENYFTIDGKFKHENVDNGIGQKSIDGKKILRSLPIVSHNLKIQGICDIVEFIPSEDGDFFAKYNGKFQVFPIEYKRGKSKLDESDIVQLVAQAMCLEEMCNTSINQGAIFYFETRRREIINITDDLRQLVKNTFSEMHNYFQKKYTPRVRKNKKCKACSLIDICLPELGVKKSAKEYMEWRFQE